MRKGVLLLLTLVVATICISLVWAQTSPQIEPSRILDLEELVGESRESEPRLFGAIRVNDSGIFVWLESGKSPQAGKRQVVIYQIGTNGSVLRKTPLPSGSRLTLTGDFGLDQAGNIHCLRTLRDDRGSETLVLASVNPGGEVYQEHDVDLWPNALAVNGAGMVLFLSEDGQFRAPSGPTVASLRASPPTRKEFPRWLPLVEFLPSGEIAVLNAIDGIFQVVSGSRPPTPKQISSPEFLSVVESMRGGNVPKASPNSLRPLLRGSAVDEFGNLGYTLMGTRPSHGIVVVRTDSDGNSLPSFRLRAIRDRDRPSSLSPARRSGEGALMFPHDFAIWRGSVFVLGASGLLAEYSVDD